MKLVNHTFIHCMFAKEIWYYFLNMFGMHLVLFKSLMLLYRVGIPSFLVKREILFKDMCDYMDHLRITK